MANETQDGFLALPEAGRGAGVLVLHAWWGLNDFFKDLCRRLAAEGFIALAPDLFQGRVAATVEEADRLVSQVKRPQVIAGVQAAADRLKRQPGLAGEGLGVIGFSFGAFWALWLAQQRPEDVRAVTLFYGTRGADYSGARAAFLGHFAGNDEWEPSAGVKRLERRLRAAQRPVTFYTYEGAGHWLFDADRPEAYHPQAAEQAWARTLAFLREQLGGAAP
jgi:carboxymethylenebutenolidase